MGAAWVIAREAIQLELGHVCGEEAVDMKPLGNPAATKLVPISKTLYTKTSSKLRPGAAARWAHDRVQ